MMQMSAIITLLCKCRSQAQPPPTISVSIQPLSMRVIDPFSRVYCFPRDASRSTSRYKIPPSSLKRAEKWCSFYFYAMRMIYNETICFLLIDDRRPKSGKRNARRPAGSWCPSKRKPWPSRCTTRRQRWRRGLPPRPIRSTIPHPQRVIRRRTPATSRPVRQRRRSTHCKACSRGRNRRPIRRRRHLRRTTTTTTDITHHHRRNPPPHIHIHLFWMFISMSVDGSTKCRLALLYINVHITIYLYICSSLLSLNSASAHHVFSSLDEQ